MSSPLTKAITVNMSDKLSIKSFGAHFVPKDCRQIKYGSETLMVYPKIDSTMPLSEKAHAFYVNWAARQKFRLRATYIIAILLRTLFVIAGNKSRLTAHVTLWR